MGFWIFMVVMDLLIPVTMIGFGRYFTRGGPKAINATFGYRTARSMRNPATWDFAHRYCGRLWFVWGWILLPVSVVLMLPVLGRDVAVVGMVGGLLCALQFLPLFGSIPATERALKRAFDSQGNRR